MAKEILTAKQHVDKIIASERARKKEKREFETWRAKQRDWEYLRDEAIGIFKNSKMSEEQIEAKGGPCPTTIKKYASHETKIPQLPTYLAFLRAMGHELRIGEIRRV